MTHKQAESSAITNFYVSLFRVLYREGTLFLSRLVKTLRKSGNFFQAKQRLNGLVVLYSYNSISVSV